MKDKDKDKEKEKDNNEKEKEKDNKGKRSLRKFPFNMARSDPTTPASVTAPPSPSATGIPPRCETPFIPTPLDLRKSLSGSQKKKLFKHTPPHTPTTLSADTAENLFKRRAERTASGASTHQRHSASFVEEGITVSPLASGASAIISPSGVTVTSPGRTTSHSIMSMHHPPVSPKTSTNPFQAPKSKFKMAHESFRIRMFQEQYGFEPVFMTKKRTADSKASEFKGGDLNKYTSRSYTIKNGNEIFGANIQNEFGICGWILTILSYIVIFFTMPFSLCMSIKVVQEYERAVIFRLGRLLPGGAKGPGIFFIVPCIDTYRKVDLRVLSFEVPPQEILSKDSVTVAVDAVVYFRISNATISVTNVEDCSRSTKLLAQTTLRNILGTKTLAEMLSDREAISLQMQSTLDEATEPWGVKVERVEVKDVRLPVQLQRAMAAEAEAAREARAKVIVAEGEQKASRALKEAAEVIAECPSALQLRYLQTLNSISAEKNSTIIFPFPIDLLSSFLHRSAPKVSHNNEQSGPSSSSSMKPHAH